MKQIIKIALALCCMLLVTKSNAQVTVIPFNDTWKYLDNGTNQGTSWQYNTFNDESWKTGNGKFGYGGTGLTTIIKYGGDSRNKYITTYFRKTVSISSPADLAFNFCYLKRDDGAVVYVNGVEVYRTNMPNGPIYYNTYASTGASDNGNTSLLFKINSSLLVSGNNVIAVEIHQDKKNSSDLAFDFNLQLDNIPPSVVGINRRSPTTITTNATAVTYRVVFSESVSNVDIADFSLTKTGTADGTITSITGSGTVYDVTVSSVIGNGTMRLDLNSAETGITDFAGNLISTGYTSGQTYTIKQTSPTLTFVDLSSNNSVPSLARIGDIINLSFTAGTALNSTVVTIANRPVIATQLSGNSFTASYTMVSEDASGAIPFTINFTDTEGRSGIQVSTTTNGSSVNYDKVVPTLLSINRQSPVNNPTNATSVTFRAVFSEAVANVNLPDFSLVKTGTAVGTMASLVAASETTYDITVNSVIGEGTLALSLNPDLTGISDLAGNLIAGGFGDGQAFTIQQNIQQQDGFSSVTILNPIPVSEYTKDKPQAKAWKYNDKWWSVLSTSGGTKIFRLDGTSWTDVLTLSTSTNSKADCLVSENLVHILLFKKANCKIYSVEFDPVTNAYKLWNQRTAASTITNPSNAETATMAIDGTGRMWVATDGASTINVWWSDAPYATWSSPITIASGITDDDICLVTKLDGKVGVFWSNQTTKLFGFRTHADGDAPTIWSADESPASQSALNVGMGMADDHMSVKRASDGTMYFAVKTSYDKAGYPELALLVRRPGGSWDDLYPVTIYEGTQPNVILNEQLGKIKIIYTTKEGGGDIVYKESSISNISFGTAKTLISGGGHLYNYATSSHQNYNPDVMIMATNQSTSPLQAVSVLAFDGSAPSGARNATWVIPDGNYNKLQKALPPAEISVIPNPVQSNATIRYTLLEPGNYIITLYDSRGSKISILKSGIAEAGKANSLAIDGSRLTNGIYIIELKSSRSIQVFKLVVSK